MSKHPQRTIKDLFSKPAVRLFALGAVSLLGSFVLGIESAGDPFDHIKAATASLTAPEVNTTENDLDGDGRLSSTDAYIALQIAQGYEEATPEQLRNVPGGHITVKTALEILRKLSLLR